MIAGYIRVSTAKQKNDGISLEEQKNMIVRHAKLIELISDEKEMTFYIDKGVSASSLDRPEMTKMIKNIKNGAITIIITYSMDRISRDFFDSTTFLKLTSKYGVVLKCLRDEINVKTASDRFGTNIKLIHNQYVREQVVEKTNDTLLSLVENGRYPNGGKTPFGWDRNEHKYLVINEMEANYVRKIFQMIIDKYSPFEVASYMRTKTKNKRWRSDVIVKLLYDDRYIGIFEYKGKIYNNIIPAIITKDDQEIAQKHYSKTKYKKNLEYYFDGLVYCSCCGTKMTCTCGTGATKVYYYYICKNCNATVSQNSLEKLVDNFTVDKSTKKEKLKIYNEEKQKLNKRVHKLREKYLLLDITDREFVSLIIPLEDRIQELQFLQTGLKIEVDSTLPFTTLSKENKKSYIQSNFKRITVNPMKSTVVEVK